MFAGGRTERKFVEVLRLRQVCLVQMPVDGCIRMTVNQFDSQLPFAAIHLFGQMDTAPIGG